MFGPLRRYLGLLAEPAFRRLWLAQTISQIGSEVTLLALPLVAVLVLEAGPFEVAVLSAVQFFAFMLLALPAGAWVDRLPRRRILVTADLGRAAILLVIPIAAALNVLAFWLLLVVAFCAAVLTVFFDIGYQAILPELVERDRLAEGNSRLEISNSAAQLLGPGIGGWLIGALSAPMAIVVDALSYLGSAAFLVGIRVAAGPEQTGSEKVRPGLRHEIIEGLRFYRDTPLLRALAVSGVTYNVGIWFAGGTFIVYLARDLGMRPETIGLGFSIGAIGVLAGAATGAGIGRRFGVGRTLVVSYAVGALSWLVMAFAEPGTALAFLALSGIGHGVTSMASAINFVSLRQAITPDALQGRVNATGRWLSWTMIPLGALGGGAVATAIGIRATIVIGTSIALLAVPLLALSPIGSLRSIPDRD